MAHLQLEFTHFSTSKGLEFTKKRFKMPGEESA